VCLRLLRVSSSWPLALLKIWSAFETSPHPWKSFRFKTAGPSTAPPDSWTTGGWRRLELQQLWPLPRLAPDKDKNADTNVRATQSLASSISGLSTSCRSRCPLSQSGSECIDARAAELSLALEPGEAAQPEECSEQPLASSRRNKRPDRS